MQFLIPKEPDAFWPEMTWLSYFLRAIVLWFLSRIESSLSSSEIKGTWRILAPNGLALLLSTSDCIMASVESRELPKQILIPKELDSFWPKATWLFYFLHAIVIWLQPTVESSLHIFWYRRNSTISGPKRLGSPNFYRRLYCGFGQK